MRDTISEQIALKSGLLLTVSECRTLLRRHSYSDVAIFKGAGEDGMRVRPEDVEELIRHLRYFIGDLPDPRHPIAARLELWNAMEKEGADPSPLIEALNKVTGADKKLAGVGKVHFTARELANDIAAIYTIDRSFVVGIEPAVVIFALDNDRHTVMNRCNRSLAAVVRMVKVSSSLPPESRQLSHGPAKAIGSPLVKAMA